MRLRVVGRLQSLADRGQLLGLFPTEPPIVPAIVGAPYLAERLDHRHLARGRRCGGGVESIEQQEPVCADRQSQRLTLLLALGQPAVLDPVGIALKPRRWRDPAQPLGRHRGQVVEGGAERFAGQLKEVQVAYSGQHIRAVRPLLPPCLEQRSEEHTSELQSRQYLVCRLLLEKKKNK